VATQNDLQPLALLAAALGDLGALAGYRRLFLMAADGVLPACRVQGRWFWHPGDLPAIRQAVEAALAAPPRRRAA